MRQLLAVISIFVGLSTQQCIDYGEFFKAKDEIVEGWKTLKTTFGAQPIDSAQSKSKTRGDITVVPILSKSQALRMRKVRIDVDEDRIDNDALLVRDWKKSGSIMDFEYVVPVCVQNQSLLMKLDFSQPDLVIIENDTKDKINTILQQVGTLPQARCSQNSTSHCTHILNDKFLNYSAYGTVIDTHPSPALLLAHQSRPLLPTLLDGFIGLGPRPPLRTDNAADTLQTIFDNTNTLVFSMCLSHFEETGGVLIVGGIDSLLYEGDIKWLSIPRLDTFGTLAGSIKLSTTTVFTQSTVLFDMRVTGILLSPSMLEHLQSAFSTIVCTSQSAILLSVKSLCQSESSMLLKGNGSFISVPKFISSSIFLDQLPPLTIHFKRDGVTLVIKNYMRRCSNVDDSTKSQNSILGSNNGGSNEQGAEEYCSIFGAHSGAEDTVILGSSVMRDYYMVVDRQFSRLGLAQKRQQTCKSSPQADSLAPVLGNETLRLVFNVLYFVMAAVMATKVAGGCMQFFDFNVIQFCKKARQAASARRDEGQTENMESTHGAESAPPRVPQHGQFEDESEEMQEVPQQRQSDFENR